MSDSQLLKTVIHKYSPDFVIPEIEALAVNALIQLEEEGLTIIPTARATEITMNRDLIRNLASKELGMKTAKYDYASNINELKKIAPSIGYPLFIKPVMSSSGKGQSLINSQDELENAWKVAMECSRGVSKKVIIEEFISFEQEITLLTVRKKNGTTLFCPPIGHQQVNGDYQCSWQPQELTNNQLQQAKKMAEQITNNLGGVGIFGVEFFISGEDVIFSELSPRPHDTGLVTLTSQNLSEFDLHVRAILDLPINHIILESPSASRVILANRDINNVGYTGIEKSLKEINTDIFIFGKPNAKKGRRMGVVLAKGTDTSEARSKADRAAKEIDVIELN